MAITFIYKIKTTGKAALEYDTNDKSAKIESRDEDSLKSLEYILRDKKGNKYSLSEEYLYKMKDYISKDSEGNIVFHTIKNSLNCSVDNAFEEWEAVRNISNNRRADKGNLQYCIVQNFGTDLDPVLANQIGIEFAQKYLDKYQCVVSTHINTGHVHNHIEFNATSFVDGKKFHNDHQAIDDIRKVSDELCQKYDLEVLEHSKHFKYVMFKDVNGNITFYEPTDRKNNKVNGEYSNKNDYRNTRHYEEENEYKQSHISQIKNDIDKLVDEVQSYEELLEKLKDLGYQTKEKTVKGEWRKHISFKNPSWEKYVRDNSLGEEYERVFLSKRIKDKNTYSKPYDDRKEAFSNQKSHYTYGKIDINDIDEEYFSRKKKRSYKQHESEERRRTSIEKSLIKEIKELNKEIEVSKKQALYVKRDRLQTIENGTKREQYLIDRINSNLNTLHFLEEKKYTSINQINKEAVLLYEKKVECNNNLLKIQNALKAANSIIVVMKRYNELKNLINNDSEEYINYEKQNDLELLKNYETILKEKNLLELNNQKMYVEKYNKYYENYNQFLAAMDQLNKEIINYDDCIFNLSMIYKKQDNQFENEINDYYKTRDNYIKEFDER